MVVLVSDPETDKAAANIDVGRAGAGAGGPRERMAQGQSAGRGGGAVGAVGEEAGRCSVCSYASGPAGTCMAECMAGTHWRTAQI